MIIETFLNEQSLSQSDFDKKNQIHISMPMITSSLELLYQYLASWKGYNNQSKMESKDHWDPPPHKYWKLDNFYLPSEHIYRIFKNLFSLYSGFGNLNDMKLKRTPFEQQVYGELPYKEEKTFETFRLNVFSAFCTLLFKLINLPPSIATTAPPTNTTHSSILNAPKTQTLFQINFTTKIDEKGANLTLELFRKLLKESYQQNKQLWSTFTQMLSNNESNISSVTQLNNLTFSHLALFFSKQLYQAIEAGTTVVSVCSFMRLIEMMTEVVSSSSNNLSSHNIFEKISHLIQSILQEYTFQNATVVKTLLKYILSYGDMSSKLNIARAALKQCTTPNYTPQDGDLQVNCSEKCTLATVAVVLSQFEAWLPISFDTNTGKYKRKEKANINPMYCRLTSHDIVDCHIFE
jgi:hypothetical protein